MSLSLKDFEIMAPVGSRESLLRLFRQVLILSISRYRKPGTCVPVRPIRLRLMICGEIARTCDEHGMKSYLTVNTIIYDKDIPLMHTIVDAAREAGISAVIAADVAVMNYASPDRQEATFPLN